MATRISFFKRPGDYQNNYKDETIYFKDSKAREILNTKQIKLKAGRGLKLEGNILSVIPSATGSVNLNQSNFTAEIDGKRVSYTTIGNPKIFKEADDEAKASFLNNAFDTDLYYMTSFYGSEFTPDSSSPVVEVTPDVPYDAYTIGMKIEDLMDDDSFDFFAIFITDISEIHESKDTQTEYVSVFDNIRGRVSYIQNYSYDYYGEVQDEPGRTYYINHEGFFTAFFKNV